jgi:tetratricopeptide (TPR) repeat protein
MKLHKYVGLISTLMFLASQSVMAGWLDDLKDGLRKNNKNSDYATNCLRYYKKRDFILAGFPCLQASYMDENFYYYVAMINYFTASNSNVELTFNSLKKAKQVLEAKQDVESKQKLARVYYAIGTLYDQYADKVVGVSTKNYYTEAMKYYEKALALAEETNEKNIQAFAAKRLGAKYLKFLVLDKAEMYLQKALKAIEEAKETEEFPKKWIESDKARLYSYLAVLEYRKNNNKGAEEHFMKALEIIRKCCYEEFAEYQQEFGYLLFEMGDYDKAEKYIKEAIERVERQIKEKSISYRNKEQVEELAKWYEMLAEVYIKKNDIARAKESLLEANELYRGLISMLKAEGETAKERFALEEKIQKNYQKIKQLSEKSLSNVSNLR